MEKVVENTSPANGQFDRMTNKVLLQKYSELAGYVTTLTIFRFPYLLSTSSENIFPLFSAWPLRF